SSDRCVRTDAASGIHETFNCSGKGATETLGRRRGVIPGALGVSNTEPFRDSRDAKPHLAAAPYRATRPAEHSNGKTPPQHAGGPNLAVAANHAGPDRTSPDSGGSGGISGGPPAGRVFPDGGTFAAIASLWGTLGAVMARCRQLRRLRWR